MTYWLASNGVTKGPYTEAQLVRMWHAGSVTAADQVCLVDDDTWRLASDLMEELEGTQRRQQEQARLRAAARDQAQLNYERRKKSEGVALVLSLLIPFGSLFYVGRIFAALFWLVLTLVAGLVTLGIGFVVGYLLSLVMAVREVRRYNDRLARDLALC